MSGKYSLPPFLRRSIYNWDLGKAGSQAHKCLRTIIYVIASEMKCSEAISKTEAIALFRFAPLAADKYIFNFAQLLIDAVMQVARRTQIDYLTSCIDSLRQNWVDLWRTSKLNSP